MDTSSRDPLLAMITENSNKWKMDALLALKDSPSCCGDHMEQETRLYKLYQSYQLYLFYQFYQMYRLPVSNFQLRSYLQIPTQLQFPT